MFAMHRIPANAVHLFDFDQSRPRFSAPMIGVNKTKEETLSNTPHTLAEEFPSQLEAIHNLKISDTRFAKLLQEYDEVNDQIHRSETRVDLLSEEAEQALRRRRMALKDAIAAGLAAAK